MYAVKTRSEGTITLDDSRGQAIQNDWRLGNLPNPCEIQGILLKASDVLSIKHIPEIGSHDKKIAEMTETELKEVGKLFYNTFLNSKNTPHRSFYEKNDVYPYHKKEVLHTFIFAKTVSWNPESEMWSVHFEMGNGRANITKFLEMDRSFQALNELKHRDGITRYFDSDAIADLFHITSDSN